MVFKTVQYYFHYMDVGIKVPSALMFLVICNPTIKNICYLILTYYPVTLINLFIMVQYQFESVLQLIM